jgi:hypothetical protein
MQFIPAHWLELAAWYRGPHGLTVYAREIRPPEPRAVTLPFRQPPRTVITRVETRKSA